MSWRLRVRHATGYRYGREVTASYNEARLIPQTGDTQLTLESRMVTAPDATQQRYWDYWGSQVTAFDLHEPHDALEVTVTSVVDTADAAEPGDPTWELLRSEPCRDEYVELLVPTPRTEPDASLAALAAELSAGRSPQQTVRAVLSAVHEQVAYRAGSTGVSTSAREAWEQRAGVCQDIAHVSLSLLRAAGVPARYVSGYLHPGGATAGVGETVTGESHAWVEAWLDGWWGFDPTNDVPAGEQHVIVARGRDYGDVTPLKGIYSGGGSQSLGVVVEVTRLL